METYTLKREDRNAATEVVWAFDLGKGSIGEAVRRGNEFLHKASLLIPAEGWKNKKGLFRLRESPRKCARVVGELISWALRPTRLSATIQVLICVKE